MSNQKNTVEELAKIRGIETDDALLIIWDKNLNHITNPKTLLTGKDLKSVKKLLDIPSKSQITSIKYWEKELCIDEIALRKKITESGFKLSERTRKLPNGAIKFLKSLKKENCAQANDIESVALIDSNKYELEPMKEWKTIGHIVGAVSKLSAEEVLRIHYTLVEDFKNQDDPIDPPGPRNANILESAISRQDTSIGENLKYPTVEMTGAALLHSLIHNHPFHNGNKRTALVSLLVFLDKNKLLLICSEDELFQYVLNIAKHKIVNGRFMDLSDREVISISEWIKNNTRGIEMGDRPLSFIKLRQILTRYGCTFSDIHSGNLLKISRKKRNSSFFSFSKTLSSSLTYGGDGREIRKKVIKKIRTDLELNEQFGIDSAAFYDDSERPVSDFIIKYQKILNRLSKL